MSKLALNLPAGRASAALLPISQCMSQSVPLNAHSSDSQDSILTQVPLSYHLSDGSARPQQQEYQNGGSRQSAITGYEAPFEASYSTNPANFAFPEQQAPGSTNAHSAPFAPSYANDRSTHGPTSMIYGYDPSSYGPPAPAFPIYSGNGHDPYQTGAPMRPPPPAYSASNYGGSNGYGQHQPGAQMGPAAAYPGANPYGQGVTGQDAVSGRYAFSYGNAVPYNQFGQGESGYNGYQAPQFQPVPPFPPTLQFQPATYGNGYPNAPGYPQNFYTANGLGYAPQSHGNASSSYVDPSDMNRGKPAGSHYNVPVNTGVPFRNKPEASIAATGVRFSAQDARSQLEKREVQNGGAVQPLSRISSAGTLVSVNNSRASTIDSSVEPSSSISQSAEHLDRDYPTPKPRPMQDSSSEPHHTRTPILRSRRGQSIVPSTAPSRKVSMHNWLKNLSPTPESKTGEPKTSESVSESTNESDSESNGGSFAAKMRRTPPRMMDLNLFKAGGLDPKTLTPLKHGGLNAAADPFIGTRGLSAAADSTFAAAPAGNSWAAGLRLPLPTMSGALRQITSNGTSRPDVSVALQDLPFVEYCRNARPDTWGVIKITNIPYTVSRSEVLAFLGRNARIISEKDFEPIHIIMERVTGKTLACFVEFVNIREAIKAVDRFDANRNGGRGGRLGHRHVEVELSTQEELMHELFPKAKNVTWNGSKPVIKAKDPNDRYCSGFQGFISGEELVMLVKNVESPQRSPYSSDSPQRPFESLVSTLLKYPWYMVDHITIADRNALFEVACQMISILQERVYRQADIICLTPMLIKRVCRAAFKCPGFTPAMKDDIAFMCGLDDKYAMEMGVPAFASYWQDLWCIGPNPGTPTDVILYYAALIREAVGEKPEMTLAQRAVHGHVEKVPGLFGQLTSLITDFPPTKVGFGHLTLAQVALREWGAIEQALRQSLTPALLAGPSV